MTLLGLIFIACSKVISLTCNIYTLIIAASAIISWVNADPYNPLVIFINQATQPLFRFLRRYLPSFVYSSSIDWTPMIVLIVIMMFEIIVGGSLSDWGHRLRYGHL